MTDNLPPPPDYPAEYKLALKEQKEKVVGAVKNNDSGMMKKIYNFCEKYDFDIEIIKKKIIEDPYFAVFFAKDPSKQKFHENLAAKYIKKLPFVENFKQLGASELVVSGGAVDSKKERKEKGGSTNAKTVDFRWEFGGKTFYASHKYTKESGGSQDNQYNDLKIFLDAANPSNNPNEYFLAIADGPYYKQNDSNARVSKIQNLKNLANDKHQVFALTIEELADFLQNLDKADSNKTQSLFSRQ